MSTLLRIELNRLEIAAVDRLLKTGLWGRTREEVIGRLIDAALLDRRGVPRA